MNDEAMMTDGPQDPHTEAPPPRHKPGRGSQVQAEERRAIQLAYLNDGMSQRQLAAKFGRRREAIANALAGPDFDALKGEIEKDFKEAALAELKLGIPPAVAAWVAALPVAAKKGDHKPVRDLLQHTDVIQPLSDHRGHGVTIILGNAPMAGLPSHEMARLALAIDVKAERDPTADEGGCNPHYVRMARALIDNG